MYYNWVVDDRGRGACFYGVDPEKLVLKLTVATTRQQCENYDTCFTVHPCEWVLHGDVEWKSAEQKCFFGPELQHVYEIASTQQMCDSVAKCGRL
jgi:hypothetical protein